MKKLILLLALLAGTLIGRSQNADFQNLYFGFYGVEKVKDVLWHYSPPQGYFQIVAESTCVVDTIVFLPGKKVRIGATFTGDTLFAGRTYPYQCKRVKLKTGRALLYFNKGSTGTSFYLITPTTYQVTATANPTN